jgi:hypothetical protein
MILANHHPKNSRLVYSGLIFLGILAAAIAGSTIGFISYEYVTRPELRDPIPHEKYSEHGHSPAQPVFKET